MLTVLRTECQETGGLKKWRLIAFFSFATGAVGFWENAKSPANVEFAGLFNRMEQCQLHPWLVPHSVQTPQAPARITLLLPQWEQVVSMYMVPRAPWMRSAWVAVATA